MTDSPTYAFGLDAVGLDDRMRLFSFITAPERHDYLWVLRAIDRARANYQVVLSTEAVAQALDGLAERGGDCPGSGELDLAARLDALDDWGVLDRTQDAARAATLAEYRRRHSVYQFTEAGHRPSPPSSPYSGRRWKRPPCPAPCSGTCWRISSSSRRPTGAAPATRCCGGSGASTPR